MTYFVMWAKLLYLAFSFKPLYTLQMSIKFLMFSSPVVGIPNALAIPSVSLVNECPIIFFYSKHLEKV